MSHRSSVTPSPVALPLLASDSAELPPAVAASALRKLVAVELKAAGFESSSVEALEELEGIVYAFFGSLLTRGHALAEHASRTHPVVKDIITASEELGVGGAKELIEELNREVDRTDDDDLIILYDQPLPPVKLGRTLDEAADDLETKRYALTEAILCADYLPALPSRHSYRRTPVFPQSANPPPIPSPSTLIQQAPSAAALLHLSTLRARLANSQNVASSLRNLIRATSSRTVYTGIESEHVGDVVDYEADWYGAAAGGTGGKKREMKMIRTAQERALEEQQGIEDKRENIAGAVVVKKRRWQV